MQPVKKLRTHEKALPFQEQSFDHICMEKARYQFLIIINYYYIVWKMRIYPLPHFQYYLPPKFFILSTDCFKFLLGRLQYPEEMKNKGYAIFFWGGGGGGGAK